jgi:excisionase family DNA binding protein
MEHHMEILLVSIPDAAKALSVGRTTVYELMRSGQLETRKMGRRRLITAESLRRLVDEQD